MRLVSFDTEDGPAAAVQLGEDLVPVSALDAPATTARGLLESLDAEGLRELGRRATRASGSPSPTRPSMPRSSTPKRSSASA
jgi:hypothetical protein